MGVDAVELGAEVRPAIVIDGPLAAVFAGGGGPDPEEEAPVGTGIRGGGAAPLTLGL